MACMPRAPSTRQHAVVPRSVGGMQVWGAPDTLTQLPAAQQAYMTAALTRMVGALGRRGLEGRPLLPALLGGVSARLDSPLQPIR